MSSRSIAVEVEMNVPQAFSVVRCLVREGISRITHASLEISARDELDLVRALAGDATVRLLVAGVPSRRWSLKVGRVSFLGIQQGSLRYEVNLYAHPWLLGFTQDVRKFRHMSAREIVEAVLGGGGVPFAFHTQRETPSRNYCVQYHESKLAFVERLLEFEGIYYTFDEAGVMQLGDRSSAEPSVEGLAEFDLLDAAGSLDKDELGVHRIARSARVASGKVTLNDYNWKKPALDLRETATAALDTELEVYDYPSGYRASDVGAYLAQIRLEALRAQAKRLDGSGNVVTFAPARGFTFGVGAGAMFAGEYMLTEVEHLVVSAGFEILGKLPRAPQGELGDDQRAVASTTANSYENRFRAIPRDVPFRPVVKTPRPTIAGNHTVMVRGPAGEEIHSDEFGRFRAQFHWDREATGTDEDSRWIRMCQESATSMVLARVGWEVTVGYIDGDPDRPVGLARCINGVMPPSYGQPSKKTVMTIKTPTYPGGGGYNEWRMDDSAGAMAMDVRAQRELYCTVQNDKSETVGNDERHENAATFMHRVKKNQTVLVGANVETTSTNQYALSVGKDRTITVGGSESVSISGRSALEIGGNDTETVGGVRLTIAGSFALNLPSPAEVLKGLTASTAAAAGSAALGGAGAGIPDMPNGAGGGVGGALTGIAGMAAGGGIPGIPGIPGMPGGGGGGVGGIPGMPGGGGGGFPGIPGGGGGGMPAIPGMPGGGGGGGMPAIPGMPGGGGPGGGGMDLGGMAAGALGGAAQGAQAAIPSVSGIADQLTGGLSSGVTLDKLIQNFTKGSIDRSATGSMSRTVGAAYVELALANIDTSMGKFYAETVGGAKLTLVGKGSLGQTVDGYLAVTVGGLILRKAKENLSYSAKKSTVRVGASLKLKSDEKIEMKADEISIEALTSLSFSASDDKVLVKMTRSKVELKGKVVFDAGSGITVTGQKDRLT